ncbi:hypothetical protein [Hymenobacter qilianensis]|uniref:hypothetical protein n=1 Tax=Hymenobacter qilianensis TaxID=1385715 RepID=UPI00293BDADF|nr:hypothetical protein [Hymenobacter qilianensis]
MPPLLTHGRRARARRLQRHARTRRPHGPHHPWGQIRVGDVVRVLESATSAPA